MAEIRDFGVTVEEYLAGLEAGIDVLELRQLETSGIPTSMALELMKIIERVEAGIGTSEEIVRGLQILSPSLRQQLIAAEQPSITQ